MEVFYIIFSPRFNAKLSHFVRNSFSREYFSVFSYPSLQKYSFQHVCMFNIFLNKNIIQNWAREISFFGDHFLCSNFLYVCCVCVNFFLFLCTIEERRWMNITALAARHIFWIWRAFFKARARWPHVPWTKQQRFGNRASVYIVCELSINFESLGWKNLLDFLPFGVCFMPLSSRLQLFHQFWVRLRIGTPTSGRRLWPKCPVGNSTWN